MYLAHIRAENFRLLQSLSLRPHPRLNLILGPNAAGKTSLLETLYCLGRAKSFRGSSPAELAGSKCKFWQVSGSIQDEDKPAIPLGVRWSEGETQVRYAQAHASAADLVRALPCQVLEPGMHRLLQDGPAYRRSFLDWGVFHVEQGFHEAWRRYQRALRQRNQALRSRASRREVEAWNPDLLSAGLDLDQQRQRQLAALTPLSRQLIEALLGTQDWLIELHSGWNRDNAPASLEARLHSQFQRDQRMGMTVEGPHRAELRMRLNQQTVKTRISRGQQKLLIAALLLAQCELIRRACGRAPLLLVDDFSAELAEPFQARLLEVLSAYPGQVFITAFEASGPLRGLKNHALFHVEQGRVTP